MLDALQAGQIGLVVSQQSLYSLFLLHPMELLASQLEALAAYFLFQVLHKLRHRSYFLQQLTVGALKFGYLSTFGLKRLIFSLDSLLQSH